jgi:diguanylate cyclase (GGDEF)-like protein
VFRRITSYFSSKPPLIILFLALSAVVLLGFIDYATSDVIELGIFYVLPISLATWFYNRRGGILLAACATLTEVVVNRFVGPHPLVGPALAWNIVGELGFFLIIVVLLSELRARLSLMEELANLDPLTGVANRRAFYRAATLEKARCQRYGSAFTIAYIDIDNFKEINDRFGHNAGDSLLMGVAASLRDKTRFTDVVARIGGDEFVVLLTETNAGQAKLAIEKIRDRLSEVVANSGSSVTFSIGVVTFSEAPGSVDETLKKVDDTMYSVKKGGKNNTRFENWPKLPA